MNRESERKRLVELIKQGEMNYTTSTNYDGDLLDYLADYLLANGIVVPPCKVGDYVEWDNGIEPRLHRVEGFYYNTNDAFPLRYDLGIIQPIIEHHAIKRIVPREEAEKMLKGVGIE
jgi:hypothetical protein